MALIFSLGVLVYSVWLIYGVATSYDEGKVEGLYNLALGVMGILLAISSLTTMRRRIQAAKAQSMRTLTVEFCERCGFKSVRGFKVGDYVHKRVGSCSQCSGELVIDMIYTESPREGF
ncbi:MAG: hypothetical protein ACUVTM_07705 [Candidatus Bathyarchaeia archaeon]